MRPLSPSEQKGFLNGYPEAGGGIIAVVLYLIKPVLRRPQPVFFYGKIPSSA